MSNPSEAQPNSSGSGAGIEIAAGWQLALIIFTFGLGLLIVVLSLVFFVYGMCHPLTANLPSGTTDIYGRVVVSGLIELFKSIIVAVLAFVLGLKGIGTVEKYLDNLRGGPSSKPVKP